MECAHRFAALAALVAQGTCRPVLFSHDGSKVATISGREVRVWDARSGRAVFAPLTHSQPVQDAQFSPDDKYLATCCSDNLLTACYAQVYSAVNGHPTGPRLNHRAGVLSVAFSPESRRVVTASADFTAIVWDCATGRQLAPPLKHENQVRSAAFSPDGRWIVTASADKTARVWDAQSGEPLTPPLRSLDPLARAGFLADQRHLFMADDQGKAQVWNLSVDQRPLIGPSVTCPLAFGRHGHRHLPGLRAVPQNRWKLFGSVFGPNTPPNLPPRQKKSLPGTNSKRKTASLKANGLRRPFTSNISWRSGQTTSPSPDAWPATQTRCISGIEMEGRPDPADKPCAEDPLSELFRICLVQPEQQLSQNTAPGFEHRLALLVRMAGAIEGSMEQADGSRPGFVF